MTFNTNKMKSNPESIHCGNAGDSFESLKKACEIKARELCESLNIISDEVVKIHFWTSDFPELICVGKFSRLDGKVIYELDYSESTL